MLLAEADNLNRDFDCFRITKTESDHFFIIHCFEEAHCRMEHSLMLLLEILHCHCNIPLSQLSASRLLTNLQVSVISRSNCRLLSREIVSTMYH